MTWDFLTHRAAHKPKIVVFTPLTEKAKQDFPAIVRALDPHGVLDFRGGSLYAEPDIRDFIIYHLNQLSFSVQPWHQLLQPNKQCSSRKEQSPIQRNIPAGPGREPWISKSRKSP